MNKKSILAIFVGVVFVVVVSMLVDEVLYVVDFYAPRGQPLTDSLALVATAYRIVIGIAGAWLTARLAPHSPVKHAVILGVVGALIGVVGAVATWNMGMGPHWYPIALAVLALPQCWAGGKLFAMQASKH